jgi:hypothetical protein
MLESDAMLATRKKQVALCLILFAAFLVRCSSAAPSDETLMETFGQHQDGFETLVSMFTEDIALEKAARNYTRPSNIHELGVSSQRMRSYRDLLRELDLLSIERSQEAILLTAYAGGASPDSGVYKGYAYFPNGVSERVCHSVVDDLDNLRWRPHQVTSACRRIDKNWFLWFLA